MIGVKVPLPYNIYSQIASENKDANSSFSIHNTIYRMYDFYESCHLYLLCKNNHIGKINDICVDLSSPSEKISYVNNTHLISLMRKKLISLLLYLHLQVIFQHVLNILSSPTWETDECLVICSSNC